MAGFGLTTRRALLRATPTIVALTAMPLAVAAKAKSSEADDWRQLLSLVSRSSTPERGAETIRLSMAAGHIPADLYAIMFNVKGRPTLLFDASKRGGGLTTVDWKGVS